jgi:hypothetical protein
MEIGNGDACREAREIPHMLLLLINVTGFGYNRFNP